LVDFLLTVDTGAEILSLALIVASFLVMAYLAYRAKTTKSFQFQIFIVLLVITVAEVPHILSDFGIIDISYISDAGLVVHTVSMVVLVAFVSLRFAKYSSGGRTAT